MNNFIEKPWRLVHLFSIVRISMHAVFIFINTLTIILYGNLNNVEKLNLMAIIFFISAWAVDVIYIADGAVINRLRFSPRRIAYSKEYTKIPLSYNVAVSLTHGLLAIGSIFVNDTGNKLWIISLVVISTLLIIFSMFYSDVYTKASTYLKNFDK